VNIAERIAAESKIPVEGVRNTLSLFDQGSTVPFITRYRKEATGSLDENDIRLIEERYAYYKELEERRQTVLKSIETQGKLTPELAEKIANAETRTALEDLYLPYKPKRRTRAMAAKEAGLEPLARILGAQEAAGDKTPEQIAAEYVNAEKGIADAAAALRGALDILAEEFSEDPETRALLRGIALKEGVFTTQARKEWEGKRSKFEMYYSFKEKVRDLPSHRILAMRRGEKENVLRTELWLDDEKVVPLLQERVIRPGSPFKTDLEGMVRDAYDRLLKPAIETETRLHLRERAEAEAFKVFQKNLSEVLLAPPAGSKNVLGVDPGFRSGVKLAVVDATGKLLEHRVIQPLQAKQAEAATTILLAMIESFKVEIVAIGNGTASREVDGFIAEAFKQLETPPIKVIVSEAGASVYSVSPIAGREFPDLDATIRSAVSIARRVQDPLAELVKIDPKSIGVGQYQHDVGQNELKTKLEQVVESCVNRVGVDVNQASEPLLAQVSGVNKALAKSIVDYRNEHGAFPSRAALVKVPHFGPKAFEQAAGFLRVRESENPLDASAVHPERYELVKKMCEEAGVPLAEMIGSAEAVHKIELGKYVTPEAGMPTLMDIVAELEKPARDPRSTFVYARFNAKVQDLKDLQEGMMLEGVVTNVTNFGAFVDIGVHQDGLVHVSELSDKFVADPGKVVAPGQVVQVRVLGIDMEQKRISLSMKKNTGRVEGPGDGQGGRGGQGKGGNRPGAKPAKKPAATLDQLKDKFAGAGPQKQNNIKLAVSLKSLMRSGR
jgi:uncharacterized protein